MSRRSSTRPLVAQLQKQRTSSLAMLEFRGYQNRFVSLVLLRADCSRGCTSYGGLNADLTLGPVREEKIGVKMTQTTRKLARFANRLGFVLLVLALIVTVSVTAYALVTHRNPFCLPLTASGSFVSMTVAELTRASETILRGAVRQIGPSWQSWQSTSWTVFTDITVDATEFLKNPQPQTTVQLRIHGGYTTC